jgi:hypothetical protein
MPDSLASTGGGFQDKGKAIEITSLFSCPVRFMKSLPPQATTMSKYFTTRFASGLIAAWVIQLGFSPVSMAAQVQAGPNPIVRVAQDAGPEQAFPALDWHSFEVGNVRTFPDGSSTLGPWSFQPGASVVHDDDVEPDTTSANDFRAAFLEGGSSFETLGWIEQGTWRLRLKAAQREGGTGNQAVEVLVDGIRLAKFMPGATYSEFISRPIHIANTGDHLLEFRGSGGVQDAALLDDVMLEPIAAWNSVSTWGAPVPTGTDHVKIPAGIEVAIDGVCSAKKVDVDGELLLSNLNGSLKTRYVLVDGAAARFEVGTEGAPFEEAFTLSLKGNNPDAMDLPGMSANTKALVAMNGGQVDMHGQPKTSWSRLSMTALAGDDVIEVDLDAASNWQAGDQIVISGTTHQKPNDDYIDYAEVATIKSVTGTTVELVEGLVNNHNGSNTTLNLTHTNLGTQWTPEQRAEVGMLTHNVKVTGVITPDHRAFGGHIMMMRDPSSPSSIGGRGRFSGVELYQMGQMGKMGRYPMHWHLQADHGAGQYFRDSSVHESFNRAITIHGTESVEVENNVAYRHIGHGIFLEDGAERFNKINHNLALSTLRPDPLLEFLPGLYFVPLLESDHIFSQGSAIQNRSPSTFWITNPNNEFRGNVAAGTEGTGYWFALPDEVLSPSSDMPYFQNADIHPTTEILGAFEDNTSHSCYSGLDLNDGLQFGTEDLIPNRDWLPTVPATIKNFTAWACGSGIYTGEGHGEIIFDNAMLLDNSSALDFAGYHLVTNSVIVGDSGLGLFTPISSERFALRLYHNFKLTDSLVTGFNAAQSSLIINIGGAQKHLNTNISGVEFDAVSTVKEPWVPNFTHNDYVGVDSRKWGLSIRDLDGSLTGIPGYSIIGAHSMMHLDLSATPGFNESVPGISYPVGSPELLFLSPFTFGHLRLTFLNQHGNPTIDPPELTVSRTHIYGWFPTYTMDWVSSVDQPAHNDEKLQLPLILDRDIFPAPFDDPAYLPMDDFRYEMDWSTARWDMPADGYLELKLDDVMDLTDRVVVSFTGLRGITDLSLNVNGTPQAPELGVGALDDASAFEWYYNDVDGVLWMVFTGTPDEDDTTQLGVDLREYECQVELDWTN